MSLRPRFFGPPRVQTVFAASMWPTAFDTELSVNQVDGVLTDRDSRRRVIIQSHVATELLQTATFEHLDRRSHEHFTAAHLHRDADHGLF